MLSDVKDIVVALIDKNRIAHTDNPDTNIEQVRKAIKEIYQEYKNCNFLKAEHKSDD